jgi:hypothetical protein
MILWMRPGTTPTIRKVRLRPLPIFGLTVLAALCASISVAAPARSAAASTKPHALTMLINGKQRPITLFGSQDHYTPIKATKLRVVARWKGSLTGTGYRIQITTTDPVVRTWRTCTTGTSCAVRQQPTILKNQQYSWIVRLIKGKRPRIVIFNGFMVCLIGNGPPK